MLKRSTHIQNCFQFHTSELLACRNTATPDLHKLEGVFRGGFVLLQADIEWPNDMFATSFVLQYANWGLLCHINTGTDITANEANATV